MIKPLMVLLALLVALAGPASAQATNPFEQNFDAQLNNVKERVVFYQNNFSDLQLPEDALPGKLAALAGNAATPQTAQRRLLALITKLDRTVLAYLKKELFALGSRISTDATNRNNFERRKFMILEFAAILKRQRIPMVVYFPKGERDLMALGMGGEEAMKIADAMLGQLATRLKEDVASPKAAGGTTGGDAGSGSGGSGGSTGGGEMVELPGGGGLSGFEEAPASVEPPRPHRPPPSPENDVSWIERFKVIVGTGVVAVIVCSLVALLLPRAREGLFGVLRKMGGKSEAVLPPMEDDLLKKGLLAINRGDYKRALTQLEKVKSPMKAPEVTYHRAICHIRLLEVEAAGHQLAMLELERTGLDEIFRLGQTCEESRMLDWAVRLYEHVERTDPSFRGVAQKVAKLKKELGQGK